MSPKEVGNWSKTNKELLRLSDDYTLYKLLSSFKSMEDVEKEKKRLIKKFGY